MNKINQTITGYTECRNAHSDTTAELNCALPKFTYIRKSSDKMTEDESKHISHQEGLDNHFGLVGNVVLLVEGLSIGPNSTSSSPSSPSAIAPLWFPHAIENLGIAPAPGLLLKV
jgi:hypothetical protein